MTYVFISHLSDDNPRLGAYIDGLLKELDEDIGLWIDTPEHIRHDYGRHPRITAIPPGAKWNEDIQRAGNGSACVLAFWSANFAKRKRTVFINEVDDARSRGRCVQVAIDPTDGWEIPQPFTRDQILEITRLDEPDGDAKFHRVIERVKQLISSPDHGGQRIGVEVHLLPYLADRHPQIMPICRSVQQRYSPEAAERLATLASLFLVPCRPDDAVDTFNWRLTSKDGPEYCGFDVLRDTPSWVKEDNLYWPTDSTPATFGKEFIGLNVMPVSAGLTSSRTRKRPVCFGTLVAASDLENDFREFVRAWTRCWPELLAQASQKISEKVQSSPPLPVVGLLFLSFDSSWLSRLFISDNARIAERFHELEALVSGMPESDAFDVSSLPPLSPVTYEDASRWLALPDIMRHEFYRRARSAVQHMFQRPRARVPMQKFAETILTSDG
jgi:hypothetical protein